MPKAKYPKNSQGLYYAYVQDGGTRADGYPSQKRIKARTIAALDEKIEKYKADKAIDLTPERISLDEWYSMWTAQYKEGCKPTTRAFYDNLYRKHISPAIGRMQLDKIKEMHTQKILTDLGKTHAEKTVKSVRSILYSLFDKARANKLIAYNPCEKLSVPAQTTRKRALTPEERTAFLAAYDGSREAIFAICLYFFGLRRGEAVALKGSDFLGTGVVRIRRAASYPDNNLPILSTPKTDAGIRDIPVPKRLSQYFTVDSLPSGYIFSNEDGSLLTLTQVRRLWKDIYAAPSRKGQTLRCTRFGTITRPCCLKRT